MFCERLNWKFYFALVLMCLFFAGCQETQNHDTCGSGPFSIIILPDTQIYSHDRPEWRNSSRKEVFIQQTTWIARNVRKENIQFVLHMGDIVHEQDKPYQWVNANEAMSILDGVVPYCFGVGNHDLINRAEEGGIIRDSTNFNNTFPHSRYENQPWFGGRMSSDGFLPKDNYDNSYHFFSAGGMDFMVITLEVAPTDEMLDWANDVVRSHPDKRVMVITHSYLEGNGTRVVNEPYAPSGKSNSGEEIWNKFIRRHKNIFFVFCGHHNNLADHKGLLASVGDNGNTVYQLISGEDYDGWLRILRFVPAENKIYVKTYSPWKPDDPELQLEQYDFSLPGYNTDPYHQYDIVYEQRNSVGS